MFIPAKPNELQIDCDGVAALSFAQRQLHALRDNAPGLILRSRVLPSKTRNHFHVTVKLSIEISDLERNALQAICGSDRVREMLNYIRIKSDSPYPILFIETAKKENANARYFETRQKTNPTP